MIKKHSLYKLCFCKNCTLKIWEVTVAGLCLGRDTDPSSLLQFHSRSYLCLPVQLTCARYYQVTELRNIGYMENPLYFCFSCSSYSPAVTTPDSHISSEQSSRRNVLANLQLLHHWWHTGSIFTFKVRLLHLCSFNSSPEPGACAAW